MKKFTKGLENPGAYIAFTHSGSLATLTHKVGLKKSISNCSCVCLRINKITGVPDNLLFQWEFPHEED